MELRKVQLTGGSSLTVTLPKAWTEKVDLQAGDVVGCSERPDGSLAVTPHAKHDREVETHRIEARDRDSEALFREIIAAYLAGFDAVEIRDDEELSREARDALRKAKTRIMGLEVIEEDRASVTVQDFLDPKEFHLDKALRRMQMLTDAMQGEADELMAGADGATLATLEERDDEVDRLFWLVDKQFHALMQDASYADELEIAPSEALNALLVARLCERTADHAERVGQQAHALPDDAVPEDLRDRLGQQWRRAAAVFQDAVAHFRHPDPQGADPIVEAAEALADEQAELLKAATQAGPEAIVHLAFIVESIGRTAAYASDVAELAINDEIPRDAGG